MQVNSGCYLASDCEIIVFLWYMTIFHHVCYMTVHEELEESLLTCSVSLCLGWTDYQMEAVPLVSAVFICMGFFFPVCCYVNHWARPCRSKVDQNIVVFKLTRVEN